MKAGTSDVGFWILGEEIDASRIRNHHTNLAQDCEMATWFEQLRLLRSLANGKIAHVGPFYVTVDITRQCNLRCPGCRYHSAAIKIPIVGDDSVRHMPWQLFHSLCDELKEIGTASMTISGEGEPFMHPCILDMIAQAKTTGLSVSVFTNGTLLNEEIIHSMIDSRLDLLKVSLWASSREEYEKNYPGTNPENFYRVIAALKLLTRLKSERQSRFPRVKLHQPIDRRNYPLIESMLNLARATGCELLSFSPFKTQRRMFSPHLLSSEEYHQVRKHLLSMKRKLKTLSMDHNIDTVLLRYQIGGEVWKKLPCYIGWLHTRVKPDGSVLPCNNYETPLGNLHENCLRKIWNETGFQNFRRCTMTREGLAQVAARCDCFFCCHVTDNLRVHQRYRLIEPLLNNQLLKKKRNPC
jgi:radical SAM protein with 4Fe4S-binding SPASM domain